MKFLRWCFPTFFRLYGWWRNSLAPAGRVLTAAMLLSLPSLYQSTGYLPELCAAGLALLLMTMLASYFFRPRLSARIASLPAVHAGERFPIAVTLTNEYWLATYDTQISLEPQSERWQVSAAVHTLPEVESQQATSVDWHVTPLRRGVYAWPRLQIENRFPFHLMRRLSWLTIPGEVVVYPHRVPGNQPVWKEILAPLLGEELATYGRAGVDGEFLGNREYMIGMRVRRWDHRRWARLGKPVVREYDDPQRSSVVLLVDNQTDEHLRPNRYSDSVEAVLALAGTVLEVCKNHDVPVSQFWQAGEEPLIAEHDALPDSLIWESLARASAVPELPFAAWQANIAKGLIDENEHLLLLFPRWDAMRQAFCNQLDEWGVWWSAVVLSTEPSEQIPNSFPIRCLPRQDYLPVEGAR